MASRQPRSGGSPAGDWASAFAVTLVLSAVWGFWLLERDLGLCGNEILSEKVSPSGNLVATVMVRNCGATTPYSTHVELRRNQRLFPGRRSVFVIRDVQNVRVRWTGRQRLEVDLTGTGRAMRYRMDRECHSAGIDYLERAVGSTPAH